MGNKNTRVLLISDPYIPVPPKGYGGIERIVELLAKEYVKLGYDVSLLAGKNSIVEGARIHSYGKNEFPPTKTTMQLSLLAVWKFLAFRKKKYDVIINFGRLIYLLPVLKTRQKKISCYQREISKSNVTKFLSFSPNNLRVVGCSQDLIDRAGLTNTCSAIFNCVNFDNYTFTTDLPDTAPLMFLGRIEKIKGCHIAIQIAKATNHQLIIAGNISPLPEEQQYYKEHIEPYIDNNQIKYVGQVNDEQKNHYLGISKALLFPIEWSEPFGIVMPEAMACGTPVIGFNRGSVAEVIEEGVTGYKVNTIEEMIEAVYKLPEIDRGGCRIYAKEKFDVAVISQQYLNLFQ
jgi:glycosyltransferase involved in cell wall biosynthesis